MMGDEIDEIKRKVFRHPDSTDLYMKRVQKEVADKFKKLANEQFLGDYGMCLKWLIESFNAPDPEVYALLENHESRISNLETKKEANVVQKKKIKMVNGTTKTIGGE
jgi:hypothetical protein